MGILRWGIPVVCAVLLLASPFLLEDGVVHREAIPPPGQDAAAPGPVPALPDEGAVERMLSVNALRFVENGGQVPNADVRYYAEGHPLSAGITPWGAVFMLEGEEGGEAMVTAFTMRFEGCSEAVPRGVGALGHTESFYVGNDPSRWVQDARAFEEVVLTGLYGGVDLRFYFTNGMLKYDLVMAPGVDPSVVRVAYEGVDGVAVDGDTGELVIRTLLGPLRDARPVAFQDGPMGRLVLEASFELVGSRTVMFSIAAGRVLDRTLVIDPGLEFFTYLGGSWREFMGAVTIDDEGNVHVVGYTESPDFMVPPGVVVNQSFSPDAFWAMFNSTGRLSRLMRFGGSGSDTARSVVTLADGSVVFAGKTTSDDIPLKNATDTSIVNEDGYLVRFLPGRPPMFCSYFGGSGNDEINDLAVGTDGSIYLFGWTHSTDMYTTPDAFNRAHSGTDWAVFAARIHSTMQYFIYSTYIDGDGDDCCLDGCLDPDGNAYLTGYTRSSVAGGFPIVGGCYDTTLAGGWDAYIIELDAMGKSVLHGTYLGGGGIETAHGIERAQNGSVLIGGLTNSTDFPLRNAHQGYLEGSTDAFVSSLDANLSILQYSTYLGGGSIDRGLALALDRRTGVTYVVGNTNSDDLEVTPGTFDRALGGEYDVFVTGLNVTSGALTYCSYIGSEGIDSVVGHTVACDRLGALYIAGTTSSNGFPPTSEVYCSTYNGGPLDVFLLKLDPRPIVDPPTQPPRPTVLEGNRTVTLGWGSPEWFGSMEVTYRVYRDVKGGATKQVDIGGNLTFQDRDVENGRIYTYTVSASNVAGESEPSEPVDAMPLGVPSSPSNLKAKSDHRIVNLSWDPPEDKGGLVWGYWVNRTEAGDDSVKTQRVINNTSWEDRDVTLGERYTYNVSAYNRHISPSSTNVTVIVVDRASPPTPFNKLEGDKRIALSWATPDELGGGGDLGGFYLLRYSEHPEPDWNYSLPPEQREYTDRDVGNGRVYRYVVMARTDLGPGYTAELNASPYGVPMAPSDLDVTSWNRSITLNWTMGEGADNGRRITKYLIQILNTKTQASSLKEIGETDERVVGGLTNGVEYIITVAAVNLRGQGAASDSVRSTPMGPPGTPWLLSHVNTEDGIQLSWKTPQDTGGAGQGDLRYIVQRRVLPNDWMPLKNEWENTTVLDTDVVLRTSYQYRVTAFHSTLTGTPSAPHDAVRQLVPFPVTNLSAVVVNGTGLTVEVRWTPSGEDPGAETTHFIVIRDESGSDVQQHFTSLTSPNIDRDVTIGKFYYYRVLAVNAEGNGTASEAVGVWVMPPLPTGLKGTDIGGNVKLEWFPPTTTEASRIIGYAIYRGEKESTLVRIATVGTVLAYNDASVHGGRSYYYSVAMVYEQGVSEGCPPVRVWVERNDVLLPVGLSMMVLLIVLIVVIAVLLVYTRSVRRTREAPAAAALPATPLAAPPPSLTVPAVPPAPKGPHYILEKVFVIFRDGRLIAECGRDECKTKDADLMSGMLIAVQGIVQDGLHSGGVLQSIKYGDNLIQMAAGRHVNLAAVVLGEPDETLKEELEATVQRIEASYSGVIEQWIGDLGLLKGVDVLVKPLLDRTAHVNAEELRGSAAAPGITVLSANDLHMGYVRLKAAVVNTTEESATEASIEVHYDHEMLRLERVRPEKLPLRGDRVSLGTVKPGERKSVAFLFDPQICQGTHIDGTLIYYDHRGELHRAEMKRRHAEVVCPILFTRKTASTAMLRRLIKEKLHASDLRVLRYPEAINPKEALELGRAVMAGFSVQMVREYVSEGPPYEAEVWYYAETKVKGYELVMRLGVVAEKRALEFFVASTDMEPITGMLAELRRVVTELMRERHPGVPELVTERDEELKAALGGRDLLIDGDMG